MGTIISKNVPLSKDSPEREKYFSQTTVLVFRMNKETKAADLSIVGQVKILLEKGVNVVATKPDRYGNVWVGLNNRIV